MVPKDRVYFGNTQRTRRRVAGANGRRTNAAGWSFLDRVIPVCSDIRRTPPRSTLIYRSYSATAKLDWPFTFAFNDINANPKHLSGRDSRPLEPTGANLGA